MRKMYRNIVRKAAEQRGITGLETAIVLIAFVVVSSVFAFAALSTGLFSSDQAKETMQAGLKSAQGSLELRGSVIAYDSDANGDVDQLIFQLANAAGGQPVDLAAGTTVIRYIDSTQSVMFESGDFTVTDIGSADSDDLLEEGEILEITMTTLEASLATNLAENTDFTIQVMPPQGATLAIARRTPASIATYTDLN